jgi:orotate phosphoribosyltransferase
MSWREQKEELARQILTELYQNRMIRTYYRDKPDGWTLFSGLYSPLYVQLRPLVSHLEVFRKVCHAMTRMVQEEAPDLTKIIGIAMAGIPVAVGMALCGGLPAGYTRKIDNAKAFKSYEEFTAQYGEHSLLEGVLEGGDKIGLVDDLVTGFGSKLVALDQVRCEIEKRQLVDVQYQKVIVILDREQGGREAAQEKGIELLSLISFKKMGLPILKDVMNPEEWETISNYLEDPTQFQDKKRQQELAKFSRAA